MRRPTAAVLAALLLCTLPLFTASSPPAVLDRLETGVHSPADAAVVVGIEDYAFLPDVPYARRDAEAFYNYLTYTRGVNPANIVLLLRSPTAKEIREAARDAAALVQPGGTLWVYFAGHGAAHPSTGKRLLLGVDIQGKVSSLEEDAYAVQLDDLGRDLEKSSADHVVLVVDSCFAGTGRDGKSLLEGKRLAVPAYAAAARPKVTVWAATSADEMSGPFEPAKHGLFTYFVVGALRGWADGEIDGSRDGQVTLDEAQRYVDGALRAVGGGEQRPTSEQRGDLLNQTLTPSGSGLEAGPDLAQLTLAERRGYTEDSGAKTETDKIQTVVTGGGDYMAKLEELKRLQAELSQLEGQIDTAIAEHGARLQGEARDAWVATGPLLANGGPIAEQAAELFIQTYSGATVTVEGREARVKIPEVDKARDWLASTRAQAEAEDAGGLVEAPDPPPFDPTIVAVAPSDLEQSLQQAIDDVSWAAETPLGRKLGRKPARAPWDDELWGDAGNKALDKGDSTLATYFYLMAASMDPVDSEWQLALTLLGQHEQVLLLLQLRVQEWSGDDEAWGDYADALRESGREDEACKAYQQATAADPSDGEWTTKLESCGGVAGSGGFAAAAGGTAAAAGSGDPLITLANALQADPTNDELVGDFGDALMDAGYFADACEAYTLALELDQADSEWQTKVVSCFQTMLLVADGGSSGVDTGARLREQLVSLADGDEALQVQVDAVTLDPSNDEAWGDAGDLMLGRGDTDTALRCYRQAFAVQPTDGEWQGRISELGGTAALFSAFEQAIAADPTNDEVIGDYGDLLSVQGRGAEACEAWSLALSLQPEDGEWQGKAGGCSGGGSSPSVDTRSGTSGAATSTPGIEAALARHAVEDTDESAGAVAKAYRDAGDTSTAVRWFETALAMDLADPEWMNQLLVLSGRTRLEIQRSFAAAQPNDEVYGDLGDHLVELGRHDEALAAFERATELDPYDVEWSAKIALLRRDLSSAPLAAISSLESQLAYESGDDELWGDYGDALLALDRRDEACEAYGRANVLDGEDAEWIRGQQRCQPLSSLELQLLIDPDDELAGTVAKAYAVRADWDQALQWFRKALTWDPADPEWMRWVLVLGGVTRIDELRDLAQQLQSDELWGDLGDAYLDVGRTDDAVAAWQRAIEIDPFDTEWPGKIAWFR